MSRRDLRTLRGQGRRAGQTCPPNRRGPDTNIRTAAGQLREKGKPCSPTKQEIESRNREKRRAGRASRRRHHRPESSIDDRLTTRVS